ncbi:accessory Sec system translocase SecA2 [Rossellomorea aquimaris]|uniref:accessory Sec system translocase SecA2 n=1 Tax=Rossellomorea aquimaris TaxID=189382 RepID=UPI0007D0599C|nr:accessory Sec system translocase SecA2 [Rossellomorea aquimaris]
MVVKSLRNLFTQQSKELKPYIQVVNKINQLEKEISVLSDEELKCKTSYFKEVLLTGTPLNELKAEAFAVVREASKRVLGMRHYDVQLIGGLVLLEGNIAEMQTGEGKTLVATLPSYLRALEEKGVHVVTANEYLASRDFEQMGKVYEFLGLSVGLNISSLDEETKKQSYLADVTYGTGSEFGFDYLRDNMVYEKEHKIQRPFHYAIIDEIDSVLIDEARTPLIIANKSNFGAELFQITSSLVSVFQSDVDYEYISETKQLYLSDEGSYKIEEAFGIENLYDSEHQELLHHVMQSLKAKVIMKKDVDYIIRDGEIKLVDQFTGRIMDGRTFSDGLHQAIEAKENILITEENVSQASITIQNYFRMYNILCGMTGSATPAKKEFFETYQMSVLTIPTNRPLIRDDFDDIVYAAEADKHKKIIQEVKEIHSTQRPILIGTTSIEQSEKLSEELRKNGIKHRVLNAKTVEDEAKMIATAGQRNGITIATNMAGRGTDIMLGEGVKELGGLYIIGTQRHESFRIDMQLRGRSGRQGDPGSSKFIISLEDDLFVNYDEEEMEKFLKRVKTNSEGLVLTPNPHKFVKSVQETVESNHESSRRHILKLDTVINQQGEVIYELRNRLLNLALENVIQEFTEYLKKSVQTKLNHYLVEENYISTEKSRNLHTELSTLLLDLPSVSKLEEIDKSELQKMIDPYIVESIERISNFQASEELAIKLRQYMLQSIDRNWINHLEIITLIKDGILLRGYAQEDPYRMFEQEALNEFENLMVEIQMQISTSFIEFIKSINISNEDIQREESEYDEHI